MSDNPYESPEADSDAIHVQPKRRSPLLTIGKLAILVVVGLLLVALVLPVTRTAREPARRNGCINNLRQIALALRDYESEHGSLPPAYTVDSEGNRLHSWRTLILPYLEERRLYEEIDLSQPWDHPVNAKARETEVSAYACPSAIHANGLTTYLGIVGPDCVFAGPVSRELSEIADDLGSTMVVIDLESEHAVPWMSPRDADDDMVLELGPDSDTNHVGGFFAAFLDGRVELVPLDLEQGDRRAMLTIVGGEKVSD